MKWEAHRALERRKEEEERRREEIHQGEQRRREEIHQGEQRRSEEIHQVEMSIKKAQLESLKQDIVLKNLQIKQFSKGCIVIQIILTINIIV